MKKKLLLLLTLFITTVLASANADLIARADELTAKAAETAQSTEDKNGLVKESDGYTYYYVDSVKQTGWATVNGNTYYFRKSDKSAPKGSATVGLIKIGDYRYYFSSSGKMYTGWKSINGSRYYFKKNTSEKFPKGAAVTGLIKIDGYRYYFTSSGKMKTGWVTIDTCKYYFKKSSSEGAPPKGAAVTGLIKINGEKYYFSSSGKMKTGLVKIDGSTYYFSSGGKMQKSCWKTVGDYRYYFTGTGSAATGGYKIGSYIYVFRTNGRLVTYDTATVVKVDGNYYYVDAKGRADTSGWFTIDSKLYYSTSSGKLKKNTTYKGITFGSKAYAEVSTAASLKMKTMSIVSQITNESMTQAQKLRACWTYMTSRSRWSYYGIYPSNYNTGWQISIAYTMLNSGRGNCYGFACAFAALANEVGYDSYVVVGRVSGTRDGAADGLTRHCWVKINGRYYDPEAQWKGWWTGCYGLSSYSISHTVSGTYRFAL
ncbi:MAG: hypothetical protein LUI07_01410 [Lachnospiraceae bacterium]|nr:hypothetical protein [Lachnospiraceae bacterium]